MANPFAVLARLQSDSVSQSALTLSAALLPVVVLTCLLLAVAMVLLTFAAFSIERKYLAILRRCREASAAGPGTAGSLQGSTSEPDVLDSSDRLLR
jgi:NADH:ubiquinone oxidoreductase subunit H